MNEGRFDKLRRLSETDALTGLHNRHYFNGTLAREVDRSQRYERSLALIVFDLDDFRAINDRLGHSAGDAVLIQVGESLRAVVRPSDIASRLGGDEFGVILPGSGMADAEILRDRLRDHLAMHLIPEAGELQISAGIAELGPMGDAVTLLMWAEAVLNRDKGEPPPAGVREPRRPKPSAGSGSAEELPADLN